MTGAASHRPLPHVRGCSSSLLSLCLVVCCHSARAQGSSGACTEAKEGFTARGAAVCRPCRAHGACPTQLSRLLVPPQIALALQTRNRLTQESRRRESPGRRPDEYRAAVRRRRRNASPVTPSRQTKRINASPRALRPRLRRIAGRRRRHGHVLEEDGRLRLEIARERRRGQHS